MRAVIRGSTIAAGFTFRNRMPKSVRKETYTPDATARIQSAEGNEMEEHGEKQYADEDQRDYHSQAEHRIVHGGTLGRESAYDACLTTWR